MPTVTSENKAEFDHKEMERRGLIDSKKEHFYHGSNKEAISPEKDRLFWVTPEKAHAEHYAKSSVTKFGGDAYVHKVEKKEMEHKYLNPNRFFSMKEKLGGHEQAVEEAKRQGFTALKHPEGSAIGFFEPKGFSITDSEKL